MPMAYSPVTCPRTAAVSANAARAQPLVAPVRNSRLSLHTANLPTSTYVFNGVEPSNLIELPSPSRGGPNGPSTVPSVWKVWNEQLRNPDVFHTELIERYRNKLNAGRSGRNWAEKWIMKYRYYKVLGEEIDRRLAKNDGKSLDSIVTRLEFIRLSIFDRKTIKALSEGIRIARGEDPIIPKRKNSYECGKQTDITSLLEEKY
jgi:hypothetical protein